MPLPDSNRDMTEPRSAALTDYAKGRWLSRKDSNLQPPGSEPGALPIALQDNVISKLLALALYRRKPLPAAKPETAHNIPARRHSVKRLH